jgi:formate dehydrogenase iron-sulfur subunit
VSLTAVERFSLRHDDGRVLETGTYSARLPSVGEQYAFRVDLDACTGCKACVVACSSMNGLDADESWRSVGLLVGATTPYQQTITTGCHHCVDPGCMAGCPVDAYEKDPVTGIVSHLDDQCIGCRYCTLTCPYEVPRFNSRLGIVRKCDMCAPRLAEGEDPACVQGCPTSAISIAIVDQAAAGATWSLPETPAPALTRPTTQYVSREPIPEDALPADHFEVRPGHAHTPLAVMLVLSQLAVGAALHGGGAVVAVLVAVASMGASIAHLGRPHLAWKAIIGVRHSWISREILALSLFALLAAANAIVQLDSGSAPPLHAATSASGLAAVGCSVAIYAATGRRWWAAPRLVVRFGLTVLTAAVITIPLALVATTVAKVAVELTVLRHRDGELGRTAVLLRGELRPQLQRRLVLAAIGGVVVPLAALLTTPWLLLAGGVLVVAGELLERSLLFTASAAPRMPGPRR